MIRKFDSYHLTVNDFIGSRNMGERIADQLSEVFENGRSSLKELRSRLNQE